MPKRRRSLNLQSGSIIITGTPRGDERLESYLPAGRSITLEEIEVIRADIDRMFEGHSPQTPFVQLLNKQSGNHFAP